LLGICHFLRENGCLKLDILVVVVDSRPLDSEDHLAYRQDISHYTLDQRMVYQLAVDLYLEDV
jgi:hypothetical protein